MDKYAVHAVVNEKEAHVGQLEKQERERSEQLYKIAEVSSQRSNKWNCGVHAKV